MYTLYPRNTNSSTNTNTNTDTDTDTSTSTSTDRHKHRHKHNHRHKHKHRHRDKNKDEHEHEHKHKYKHNHQHQHKAQGQAQTQTQSPTQTQTENKEILVIDKQNTGIANVHSNFWSAPKFGSVLLDARAQILVVISVLALTKIMAVLASSQFKCSQLPFASLHNDRNQKRINNL